MNTPGDSQDPSNQPAENPQPVLGYALHKPSANVIVWCRLLAVAMFAYGIEQFVSLSGYLLLQLSQGATVRFNIAMQGAAVIVVWPVLGWYCWSHAPDLAMRVSRGTSDDDVDESDRSQKSDDLLTVALMTLGVYQFVEGLPLLVLRLSQSGHRISHSLADLPWADMADPLVRLAIGALLIFGNRISARCVRTLSGHDQ
jgi:hypothetical protein